MKKVIIAVAIIAFIFILIISSVISNYKEKKLEKQKIAEENAKTTKVYTSLDNAFSIELSKSYKLIQSANSSDYLLNLVSSENLGVHISKIKPIENKSFNSFVKADRLAYSQSFTYSNLSDLKELLIGDKKAFTYSFHYLDKELNSAFFIQIVWIDMGDYYYCFDIDFPLKDLAFYTNIVTECLSTFKKIN